MPHLANVLDRAHAPLDAIHLARAMAEYRERCASYCEAHREPGSTGVRDANATVILVAGASLFNRGRTGRETFITGATAPGVALPPREAFPIEFRARAKAKLRRPAP